jgi:hypothetical protein
LDKNEEKEREVKKETNATKLENVTLPVAPEYGKTIKDVLEAMDNDKARVFSLINKDARSLFRNKRALKYIAHLLEYNHRAARISLIAYFSADYLDRKIEMLEEIIMILMRQLKDLPAPEDIKELREFSTRKTELDLLMKKLKELTDQAEKEKGEAFRKIDVARQQVLKDVV